MSSEVGFTIDGVEVTAAAGQTILEAADAAGIYIPRLCRVEGLPPHGSCRVCTVVANGRPCSACTQPATAGMVVDNDTPKLNDYRRMAIEMLFVEGNHFCMVCEKSGHCELQALAYRLGISVPRFPFLFPQRDVDADHTSILVDRNRCVLCGRCERTADAASLPTTVAFLERGPRKHVALRDVPAGEDAVRALVDACPVGALLAKRSAFRVPVGRRPYDTEPIGASIESRRRACGGSS